VVLVHELWQGDQRLGVGVVPFVPNKHLALSDPELRAAVQEADGGFGIEVTAQRLARFVWLALDGTSVIFSDNYFDLPAGRTARVTLPGLEGWTAERVRQSLRVRSLVDAS
jgi:beta-mannosidase